jgi:sortase (surface protein transpeptidase)
VSTAEAIHDSPLLEDHSAAPQPTSVSSADATEVSAAQIDPTEVPAEPAATADAQPEAPTAQLMLDPTEAPPVQEPQAQEAVPAALPAESQPAPAAPAAPAEAPAAPPPSQSIGQPTRLVIDAIGMDRSLISVGLDPNNIPIVPKHDIGWYNLSAVPGQGENVVLWGHVLRFRNTPDIPAPFARLKELQPGAQVTLYDDAGNARAYVVTEQVWATPDQVEYILPKGKEVVTMVSCIGDKVVLDGSVEMTNRLITIAEPA